jgi:hypothetical protein
MPPSELFLSHSSSDRLFADSLAETIRQHGIPVWYSQTNILGAQQWHDEIATALARCDWFALILSPNSAESMWVKRELLYALTQNRFENKIVPYSTKPVNTKNSPGLFSFQMVDFTSDLEQGYRALMRVWGLGYRP